MKQYIGIKKIQAEPMTLGDYNTYRGWIIPADENPNKEGYLVKYSDDYVSWSPKNAFEDAYQQVSINRYTDSTVELLKNTLKIFAIKEDE